MKNTKKRKNKIERNTKRNDKEIERNTRKKQKMPKKMKLFLIR